VMAGWDVTVSTADHGDSRALEILGVRARDLESMLALPVLGPCLEAIAVQADLYDSDARVRRMVLTALDAGLAEVRFWGEPGPEGFDGFDGFNGGVHPVSHRLSAAARAFKAQALAAANAPASSNETIEVFRRGGVRRPSPIPAG
jgi:hypothetical protein